MIHSQVYYNLSQSKIKRRQQQQQEREKKAPEKKSWWQSCSKVYTYLHSWPPVSVFTPSNTPNCFSIFWTSCSCIQLPNNNNDNNNSINHRWLSFLFLIIQIIHVENETGNVLIMKYCNSFHMICWLFKMWITLHNSWWFWWNRSKYHIIYDNKCLNFVVNKLY